jgi:hypothetical protein
MIESFRQRTLYPTVPAPTGQRLNAALNRQMHSQSVSAMTNDA